MEPRLLHRRFVALIAGVLAAAAVIAAVCFVLPAQDKVEQGVDYGYVYSGVKSSSVPFMTATMDDESLLVFGSSEFSTPASIVPQVPASVFGGHDYGLHLMLVGEAFDQSLWHAIALGACAREGVPRNKAVIVVGPGWFVDGGMDAETFSTRFSYALYAGFCANESLPAEVKEYVKGRLATLGVGDTELQAGSPTLPQDFLNNAAFSALDDLKARRGLEEVRAKGTTRPAREDYGPDFDALRAQALADGQSMAANNEWGIQDAFYHERIEPVLGDLKDARAGETYSQTDEYDDLDCFLDVADACGIEVLVVIQPELGPYYDLIGIPAETRAACYDRICEVAQSHGAAIADFSDREYERYFLYDIVHFGWLGWVDAEQSIWEFAMKDDNSSANGEQHGRL